jgi:PII-like signaling protein
MVVIAVGSRDQIMSVLPDVSGLLRDPLLTLEPVRVCKRDGLILSLPGQPPEAGEHGTARWQKLTVYTSQAARHDGQPVHRVLARRLLAAGFVADDEELMLVAETAAIDSDVKLPDGVRLDLVTDHAGVEAMMAVHDLAFTGHPSAELGERLVIQLRDAPELVQMVVAMAGDEPVSAARVEFIPGTDFAGLWGGGTVPAWRGRGIFHALVAYRAGLAAARGYRYLQVDALPASRPILQRLGFKPVAATTPYVWTPPASG